MTRTEITTRVKEGLKAPRPSGQDFAWLPRAMLGALLFLLCASGASYILANSYRSHHAAAVRDMTNVAAVIAAYTERTLASAESVIASVQDAMRAEQMLTPERFREAASSEAMHRRIVARAQSIQEIGGIAIFGLDGRLLNVSRQWPVPRVNVSDLDYFQAVRNGAERFISRPLQNRVNGQYTLHLARPVRDQAGNLIGVMSAGMDLSEFSRIFGRLQLQREHRIHLLRNDGVILTMYPMVRDLLGTGFGAGIGDFDGASRAAEVTTNTVSVDGASLIVVSQRLQTLPMLVALSMPADVVERIWLEDGIYLILFAVVSCILILIATAYSIARMKNTASLSYVAYHDFLTGLPNRLNLQACLERLSPEVGQGSFDIYVLFLDLDRFKKINDTLGHVVGDGLLVATAQRLPRLLQYKGCRTEIIARLGGDEFAAVVKVPSGARSVPLVRAICDAVVAGMAEPFIVSSLRLNVSTSVGAVHWDGSRVTSATVLESADEALNRAKLLGRGTYRLFDDEMAREALEDKMLSRDLRTALSTPGMPDFEVHYQPIVDLQTMEIIWFEALIRWRHAERGFIRPDRFVAVAEELGLTFKIGEFVMAQACRAALAWPEQIGVSINASSSQFQDGGIVRSVTRIISDTGIDPHRVILEITEGTLLENTESTMRQLRTLYDLGIRVAIDDFGTGYSSLGYLKSFPFSKIKIDKRFVSDVVRGREDQAVVNACCMLAKALSISTTAEGVETIEQLEAVRAAGCREVQGYLFSRPVPLSALETTIKSVSAFAQSLSRERILVGQ